MISLWPAWTKATRSASDAAERLALRLHPSSALDTFSTTVSKAARLAVLTLAGSRFVNVTPARSVPEVGRKPPLIEGPDPTIATFTDVAAHDGKNPISMTNISESNHWLRCVRNGRNGNLI